MKLWKRTLTGLAVGLCLSSALQAAETIKIAIAGPQSGSVAQYGEMQFNGVHAAIDLINKAGGVKGKMLEAVEYDDACEPKQAVAVANKVVNDGVQYVVGHLCSGSTQPATDVYEDEGILAVTCSTNPSITERGFRYIFRTIGLDSAQGPTAGKYIAEHLKPKRVAVIHDKQQYGEGIASSVKSTLESMGVNVVAFEGVTAGDKDFSSLIAKLKKENVDLVYYGGYHPELGLILRQSNDAGFKPQFMGPEAVGNKEISSIAGPASEGLIVTLPARYDLNANNADVVALMKSKGQDPTGPFVWTSVAAVQSLVEAMNKVGDGDTEKVADYLRENTINTSMGPLTWDDKGDLEGFEFGLFTWHQDGTSTPL
ncbi:MULTISPECIES: branched-chain amino acid ABC transporter substrate-binding protein [unclassified Hahella]|uniref:branched-chain amino acid ABC transporter substrate-binding protein n=1 Tax=unclassified Hahella TaxID=2624107 RepID=UPI001C1E8FDD|nr:MULTISPECIES: branched-chain amino acid ABC transporter substrate-binding protein [unclassified Hahella]MBU6950439.1 branched-chain amino acid ABC transporter substrate-binding protein [Hahella sp. HN01]MDG9666225.1 branched-chain amino acid ABC transporter substrate-binding protein [Hahella sp. CR1]